MPRKKTHQTNLNAEAFLRSINLQYDADQPQRIAHFHPTSKCVPLLKALLGEQQDRAFFVVAPYGTGKSLTATYLLHLVENRDDSAEALKSIETRLKQVSPELAQFSAKRRRKSGSQGLVLALHGHCPSLPKTIKEAVLASMARLKLGREARPIRGMSCDSMDEAIELLLAAQDKCSQAGLDRIAIVWDEFGRHIETLIAEGRHADLIDLQVLAEFASRCDQLPLTLGLLLHQGLLHYASNVPQSVRAEWTKIEGRFETIQYVDDSEEIYRLISEVVASRFRGKRPSINSMAKIAKRCKAHNLFGDFTLAALKKLLAHTYPLEPVSLYLLPRVAARVAQNERTLFSFLYNVPLKEGVSPDRLYDYFSASMRSDTAVGGTHRQWLETESAITKVGDDAEAVKTLKIACLLGLGTSGERSRAGYDLLIDAIDGCEASGEGKQIAERLIEEKLLLHRRHSDEVSVWHGTDADLRGRLEEEKRRHREGFDLLDFLAKETQPPTWRPVQYNDDFAIRRYLTSEYQSLDQLDAYLNFELQLQSVPVDCDGKVLYLVAETDDELHAAEQIAQEKLRHDRVLLALPSEPLPLTEAALEVWCLTRMQHDAELVGSDPLILPEIQQMADDARAHLQRLVDRFIWPSEDGARWFHSGHELDVPSARDLRLHLSQIMHDVYPMTPRINNEVIVRKKPSPVIVNARKKLVLGILERFGQPQLGLEGHTPDVAAFRTVLLHTGIYREEDGRSGYAAPHSISDKGLREVWGKIQEFLTEPSDKPKLPSKLFHELMKPPYGVRAGVIPILFAAGLKAFPSAISLTKKGEYVTDILPSVIEDLCKEPESYRVVVLDLDDKKLTYLRGFHELFSAVEQYEVAERDLIRQCFDALEAWKAQLPPASLTTRRLSEDAEKLQRLLKSSADPVQLLLGRIPAAYESKGRGPEKLLKIVAHAKAELEGVARIYSEQAADSLRRTLSFGRASDSNARDVARRWSSCFPGGFTENLSDQVSKGLISRMQTSYDSDELLINSLAHLLVGKSLSRWDDSTLTAFARELQAAVKRVEEAALHAEADLNESGPATEGLATLITGRVEELYERLVALVGEEQAQIMMTTITKDHTGVFDANG